MQKKQISDYLRSFKYQAIIFTLISIVFSTIYFRDPSRNMNYRIMQNNFQASQLLHFDNPKAKTQNFGDDVGQVIVLMVAQLVSGTKFIKTPAQIRNFSKIPDSFYILWIFLTTICLLYVMGFLYRFLGWKGNLIFGLGLLFSPAYNFLAHSGDIYLFPIYSAVASWYICQSIKSEKVNWQAIICHSIFLVITCYFRSSSKFFFILPLIYCSFLLSKKALSKTQFLKLSTFFSIFFLFYIIPSNTFILSSHSTWHALRTGLSEYGSIINVDTNYVYPSFVRRSFIKPGRYYNQNRWNDGATRAMVQAIDPSASYLSKKYEKILKRDFFYIVSNNKLEFFKLVIQRLGRLVNINPIPLTTPDSFYLDNTVDWLFKAIAVMIIVFGFKRIPTEEMIILYGSLGISSLGSLLVHSGYLMYNIGFIFIVYIIFARALFLHMKKTKGELKL